MGSGEEGKFESRILCGFDPLVGIKILGVKNLVVCNRISSITQFAILLIFLSIKNVKVVVKKPLPFLPVAKPIER